MICEDLMRTDVEWLSPEDTVQAAAHRMREYNVSFLPVCQERQVLGTLTAADIVARIVAEDWPVTTPVVDIMTTEIASCRPSDELELVQRTMSEQHQDRLLCLDERGQLVGILTMADIARTGRRRHETTLQTPPTAPAHEAPRKHTH